MARNSISSSPLSTFRGDPMAAFDRLPLPIRRALHEAIVAWDPRECRWLLNKAIKAGVPQEQAVWDQVADIQSDDEREVRQFAYHWPARFGRLTPHVRADATILRYDEVSIVRRRATPTPSEDTANG